MFTKKHTRREEKAILRFFETARLLVRFDHVASFIEHDQLDGEAVKCIIEKSPRRQSAKFRFLEAG